MSIPLASWVGALLFLAGVYTDFLSGEWLTIRAQALGTLPLFSGTGAQDHALVRITEDW